jgi:hypothetical protein
LTSAEGIGHRHGSNEAPATIDFDANVTRGDPSSERWISVAELAGNSEEVAGMLVESDSPSSVA